MGITAVTLVGEFVLYVGLGYFCLVVALALSGETVQTWPLPRRTTTRNMDDRPVAPDIGSVSAVPQDRREQPKPTNPKLRGSRNTSESHLELLDRLRTNLKYQGSTIALIVFAVLLLGLRHVRVGSEIGTLLGRITEYALGTSGGGSDSQAAHSGVTETYIPDTAAGVTGQHPGPPTTPDATAPPKEHP